MKKLLLILLCLPMIGFGQQTYVPDDAFEGFLEANGMGNGISNDDYVTTASIDTVTVLNILYFLYPTNLIGIEDFTLLEELNCSDLQLSSLDVSQNNNLIKLDCSNNLLVSLNVSQNSALSELSCWENQLTQLDINQNIFLTNLICGHNEITSLNVSNNTNLVSLNCENNWVLTALDVSNNTALTYLVCQDNLLNSLDLSNNLSLSSLTCQDNQITSLDVSQNSDLIELSCGDNQLTSLNISNGNNNNITYFSCDKNFSLNCINVDDVAWSITNLTDIDPQHYFSTNCSGTAIEEHTTNKELLEVTGLLGREIKQTNEPLFYIYDDGTVEKRIILE